MEVTRYRSDENVKEILTHCKVNLKNCKHPQESAYSVVGKLKVQPEVAKEDGVNTRRNMASEIQKLQNKKRRIS
ncbi:hypothetical protein LIER_06719 [Lithospermum erythrorhizon]|uniref:Uncharacterized protein n=1 Tax=Lithospermum erythrorhizon TaxID=34254 RepID=A0AAV3P844_LITER